MTTFYNITVSDEQLELLRVAMTQSQLSRHYGATGSTLPLADDLFAMLNDELESHTDERNFIINDLTA